MIPRLAKALIVAQLKRTSAVAVSGPRQVGKTTLGREIAAEWPSGAVYLDLERPSHLLKISDPEFYLKQQAGKLIVLDEIQRAPHLLAVARAVIAKNPARGKKSGPFLLLGSASFDLAQGAPENRMAHFDLGVINASEIGGKDGIGALWLRGGLPNSFLAADDEASFMWREDFINGYLERDIPALGPRVPPETMRQFWTMLAHSQGQVLNQSKISENIGVSITTVGRYLDLLTGLLLIRRLRPWSGDIGKRLVKSPKYYIRDSGLLHALLNIQTMDELMGHPIVGKSWEGFAIENLLAAAPRQAEPFFFQTSDNVEIDLVLETGPRQRIAVAVRRGLSPPVPLRFHKACEALKIKNRYVVYPGASNFYYAEGLEAMSLEKMMAIIASKD